MPNLSRRNKRQNKQRTKRLGGSGTRNRRGNLSQVLDDPEKLFREQRRRQRAAAAAAAAEQEPQLTAAEQEPQLTAAEQEPQLPEIHAIQDSPNSPEVEFQGTVDFDDRIDQEFEDARNRGELYDVDDDDDENIVDLSGDPDINNDETLFPSAVDVTGNRVRGRRVMGDLQNIVDQQNEANARQRNRYINNAASSLAGTAANAAGTAANALGSLAGWTASTVIPGAMSIGDRTRRGVISGINSIQRERQLSQQQEELNRINQQSK